MSLINREILLSFEKMDADLCATCGDHHTAEDVIMMIKTAPTVDAVPVVRCKDCARCITYRGVTFCNKWRTFPEVELDGFCSYAERKEGAD